MAIVLNGDTGITTPDVDSSADISVNGLTVGKGAGNVATNTAVGVNALVANTSGSDNAAFGANALDANTSGIRNAAFGSGALGANTTGTENTAVGRQALLKNTTASSNVAVGQDTLRENLTGANNTGVGTQALQNNTTASNNTAVGYQAGYSNTTGVQNTFLGHQSGYSNTTSQYNTFIGRTSGYNTTGGQNTFIGGDSGYYVTTGTKNTILGFYNGNQGGLDIRTSSNYVVLSDGDGNPRMFCGSSGQWYMRSNTSTGQSLEVTNNTDSTGALGQYIGMNINQSNTSSYALITGLYGSSDRCYIYANGNIVNINNSYGALSDERLKENIVDSGSQWDDIKAIRVRKYSMKEDSSAVPNRLGVIAQELEASGMTGLVFESPDRQNDGETIKQVNYSVLYMKAVKALQEAMTRIEQLEADVAALKG